MVTKTTKKYTTLYQKEQIAFRKQVRDFRDNIITDKEKKRKQRSLIMQQLYKIKDCIL